MRGKQLAVHLKIAFVVGFVVFALIGCSETNARREFIISDSKSYEASLFRQNCAICHGQEANGKEIDRKLVPSLRYGDAAKRSKEEIYQQIKNGKLPMPSFKNQMSEEDINKMVNFVMHDLQGRN